MTTQQNTVVTVRCPTCQKAVPWDDSAKFKPFCSQRCQLIDLGDWITEAHKIPGENVSSLNSDDESADF